MKATLEYNLPDEREYFQLAIQAHGMACVISDLDKWLRDLVKYHEDHVIPPEAAQMVRDKLFSLREEMGVDLF